MGQFRHAGDKHPSLLGVGSQADNITAELLQLFHFSSMQMNKTMLPLGREGGRILVNVAC